MSFNDWSGTRTSRKQHSNYIGMSTIEDLSYTPSAEEQCRDAAQIAATGRTNWKTLRGKGEAVWPPQLEAALIEALEKYRPDRTRSTKSARFPLRNKFISDYIFESTGKRRTPKQVGSRLQQLRDTCKGERILYLLSRRTFSNERESSEEQSSIATPPPLSPSSPSQLSPRHINVWVSLILESTPGSYPPPVVPFVTNSRLTPLFVHLSPVFLAMPSDDVIYPMSHREDGSLSHLRYTSSQVKFTSPFPLSLPSLFSVYADGMEVPLHTEAVTLECLSSPAQGSGWMYSTNLVPSFWKTMCDGLYTSRYTIVQQISSDATIPSPGMSRNDPATVSIIYTFESPQPSGNLGTQSLSATEVSSMNASSLAIRGLDWLSSAAGSTEWSRNRSYDSMDPLIEDSCYAAPSIYRSRDSHTADLSWQHSNGWRIPSVSYTTSEFHF